MATQEETESQEFQVLKENLVALPSKVNVAHLVMPDYLDSQVTEAL